MLGRRHVRSSSRVASIIVLSVTLAACSSSGDEPARPSTSKRTHEAPPIAGDRPTSTLSTLSRFPPIVEKADLRLLEGSRSEAELRVRYADDHRLAPIVPLFLEHGLVELRDDGRPPDETAGDRMYTARINLDVEALQRREARLAQISAERQRELIYVEGRDRTIERRISMLKFPLDELLAGVRVALLEQYVSIDEIEDDHSLFITDLSVVNDSKLSSDGCPENDATPPPPLGSRHWTFGYLISQLAGSDPSTFALNWLAKWESDQPVNGLTVAARPNVSFIRDRWRQLSGGATQPLDMAKAPFRLLAIVLRIDLADNPIYAAPNAGDPPSGGELRFVFGGVGADCTPTGVTVIFEYGVHASSCVAMRDWARQWVDLRTLPFDQSYNDALEALTQKIVAPTAGSDLSGGLNQIRTNESVFVDTTLLPPHPWELREFNIDPSVPGVLRQDTVKQTPDASKNRTQVISDYVNTATPPATIPAQYPAGSPFLGGSALMIPASATEVGTYWDGPTVGSITDPEARFLFSRDTCSGCHAGETHTGGFHVDPRQPLGSKATLSEFLTGSKSPVPDPSGILVGSVVPTHTFGDLDLRRVALARFANQQCVFWILRDILRAPPIFTH